MSIGMPKTDKEYQAERDARILMDYHLMKKDGKRLAAASKVLAAKVKAQQEALKAAK